MSIISIIVLVLAAVALACGVLALLHLLSPTIEDVENPPAGPGVNEDGDTVWRYEGEEWEI